MVRLSNYLLRQKHLGSALVQLGGLEPPTSCSTDSCRILTKSDKARHYFPIKPLI